RISSPKSLQAHANALAKRGIRRTRLVERQAVGGTRRLGLVLGHQYIALGSGVLGIKSGAMLFVEQLQRLVIGFLVEQHGREPQPRKVAEIVEASVFVHP